MLFDFQNSNTIYVDSIKPLNLNQEFSGELKFKEMTS